MAYRQRTEVAQIHKDIFHNIYYANEIGAIGMAYKLGSASQGRLAASPMIPGRQSHGAN